MLLNRDKYIPEITQFRNKADKLIVVYDDDERQAAATATSFVQKGFDNIFLLTNGMNSFIMHHEEHLIANVPLEQLMPQSAGAGSVRGSSRPGGRGGGGGGGGRSWDQGSVAGSVSVAGSIRGGSDFGSRR